MLVLGLDTTSPAGSVALTLDGAVLGEHAGDAARVYGERLPGDALELLSACGRSIDDVDVYAIAAGPGSLTGLRVGIATIQGFALASGRPVVAVPVLEAVALASWRASRGETAFAGAWTDARRGEVFWDLFRVAGQEPAEGSLGPLVRIAGPGVGAPDAVAQEWSPFIRNREVACGGDGARRYAAILQHSGAALVRLADVPLLAGIVCEIATRRARQRRAVPPHAVQPVYVRRPDAELARDRARSTS